MPYYDDFKSPRFRNAVTIGEHADMVFAAECLRRGLDPGAAMESPIDAIANSPIIDPIPMNREQVLDLWYEGLTGPEIMALGATYPEFLAAIKTGRAQGDPRAYYRQGKTRLPWQVNLTARAKQKAQEHRIVSNEQEPRKMEKRPSKPRSPSVGPSFVGKAVDDLVSVFAQIDDAKRELDKRFVPGSDILRSEISNKD